MIPGLASIGLAVVQARIASREEVLQTLTGYMHSGEPRDSVRLRAAELMGTSTTGCLPTV